MYYLTFTNTICLPIGSKKTDDNNYLTQSFIMTMIMMILVMNFAGSYEVARRGSREQ